MTSPRDTPSALAALLDALEADLLGAPTQEARAALRETGRTRDSALYEMRAMLRDVQAGDDDRCALTTHPDRSSGVSTRRH